MIIISDDIKITPDQKFAIYLIYLSVVVEDVQKMGNNIFLQGRISISFLSRSILRALIYCELLACLNIISREILWTRQSEYIKPYPARNQASFPSSLQDQ